MRSVGVRGFHAREQQQVLVRAILEGDLFLSARSSFFFLLSSFFFILYSLFFLLSFFFLFLLPPFSFLLSPFSFLLSPFSFLLSSFFVLLQINKISGIQIAIEAKSTQQQYRSRGDDHARQTQTVPRWNVFRHNVQNKNDPSLSRAQRWIRHEGTSVQQYAGNYTESCHDKTKMCDLVTRREFSCLQEISGPSRSVLKCLAVQNKAFAL